MYCLFVIRCVGSLFLLVLPYLKPQWNSFLTLLNKGPFLNVIIIINIIIFLENVYDSCFFKLLITLLSLSYFITIVNIIITIFMHIDCSSIT